MVLIFEEKISVSCVFLFVINISRKYEQEEIRNNGSVVVGFRQETEVLHVVFERTRNGVVLVYWTDNS